jgi:hypothetical protein
VPGSSLGTHYREALPRLPARAVAAQTIFENLASPPGFFARFSSQIAIHQLRSAGLRLTAKKGALMNHSLTSMNERINRHLAIYSKLCSRTYLQPKQANKSPASQVWGLSGDKFGRLSAMVSGATSIAA